MNFLAGMLLLFLEPEDSFWGLIAVTEKYFSSNYFDQNLIGAQVIEIEYPLMSPPLK